MRAGIYMRGTGDLVRAYGDVSKDLRREMTDRLKTTAEPVRAEGERLSVEGIRNIGLIWSRMRLGYARGGVYLAPAAKRGRGGGRSRGPGLGRGTPRPNLAALLLNRSMLPAVANKQDEVVVGLERLLDELAERNGF